MDTIRQEGGGEQERQADLPYEHFTLNQSSGMKCSPRGDGQADLPYEHFTLLPIIGQEDRSARGDGQADLPYEHFTLLPIMGKREVGEPETGKPICPTSISLSTIEA